jgi:predicted N-formylglutamate amidohydrolase
MSCSEQDVYRITIMQPKFIITCEHAGNEIPDEFLPSFSPPDDILRSHRGWDPGALNLAEFLAEHLSCSLHSFPVTRLLIETNRSLNSPQLFSGFSKDLPGTMKLELINEYYHSYRGAVEEEINALEKPVIHISVHTFTPVWEEKERKTDIGLLFDPSRRLESVLCGIWQRHLRALLPDRNIEMNEPYKGVDDGFTTHLRTVFADETYAGIELEINQKYNDTRELAAIQSALIKSILS